MCIVFIVYTPFLREGTIYWRFGRGCTILLGIFGMRLVGFFFNYVQNHAGGWLEFHFIVRALPGSYLDQVILLLWPKC